MYSEFMFRNLHPVKLRFSHTMIPYDVYETVYVPHEKALQPCACDSSRPKFQNHGHPNLYIYICIFRCIYICTNIIIPSFYFNKLYICSILVICICDFCRGVQAIIDVVLLMFSVKLLWQCEPLMTTFQQGSTSVEFGCIHGVDLSPLEWLQFSCIFMWNIMKPYSIHLVAFSAPATCCVCRNR